MIVNKSTNIIKMKNYILNLSPQINIIENKKDQEIYDHWNPSSDLRQALKVAEPNQLMAIPAPPLHYWISNSDARIDVVVIVL